jgi:hypothetical protein
MVGTLPLCPLLDALSILLICWFVERISGTAGALACLFLLLGNRYFLDMMGRAREEAPLIGLSLLVFYSVYKAAAESAPAGIFSRKSVVWLFTAAVLSGLAGGLKLNGAILSFLGPVAAAPFFMKSGFRSLKFSRVIYWICLSCILISVSFVTFVVVNPSLHQAPLKGSLVLYEHRVDTMSGQMERFPQQDMRGMNVLSRIKRISYKIFGTCAALHFPAAIYVNICLFLYGIALTAAQALRPALSKGHDPAACRVFLLGSLVSSAVIVIFLNLDWNRFYCIPVIFSTGFIAIGLGNLYRTFAVSMRMRFTPAN